jgi:ParB/RepB/Spo0J family partition protein
LKQRFEHIPLGALTPSPTNPRKRFDPEALEELAESVRTMGVIQPIVARELAPGAYEVVAGERRFRASVLAQAKTIPAMVRELTDAEVAGIQLLENNQRADVHPLEEAEAMRRCLDAGTYGEGKAAVAAMAAQLGRSVSYVYGRLQLLNLSKEARMEHMEGNIAMSHATLMLPLNEDGQRRCLSYLLYDQKWTGTEYDRGKRKDECKTSVRELAHHIGQNLTRELAKAPFDIEDAELVPEVGACVTCPFRTGAAEDAKGKDTCLSPGCYDGKRFAAREKRIRLALEADPLAIPISTQYSPDRKDVLGMPILSREQFEEVQEGTPGARPGVIADAWESSADEKFGKILWVRERSTPEQRALAEQAKKAEADILQRELKVEREFRRRLLEATAAYAYGIIHGPILSVLVGRLMSGQLYESHFDKIARAHGWAKDGQWSSTIRARIPNMTDAELADLVVWLMFVKDLDASEYDVREERRAEGLIAAAKAAGIDVDHVRREAEEKYAPKVASEKVTEVFAGTNDAKRRSARGIAVAALKSGGFGTIQGALRSRLYHGMKEHDFAMAYRFGQNLGRGRCAVTFKGGEQYVFAVKDLAAEAGLADEKAPKVQTSGLPDLKQGTLL